MEPHKNMSTSFGKFSNWVARFAGSPTAFIIASLTVVVWALTGPVFHYTEKNIKSKPAESINS